MDAVQAARRNGAVLASLGSGALLLLGVLALGWNVWTVLAVYWLENVVLGIFTLPRLALARGPVVRSPLGEGPDMPLHARRLIGLAAIPFFAFHYGMFCLVHGFFALVILPSSIGAVDLRHPFDLASAPVAWEALLANGAFIAAGAAVEVRRWIRLGQAHDASIGELMSAPYGRVVVLHLVLLLGGVAISGAGNALPLLVALVVGKSAYDLRRRRTTVQPLPEAAPAS